MGATAPADTAEVSEEVETEDSGEPRYKFDGFTVEFSEKVALIPVAPPGAGADPAAGVRHG
jgi:hypothetical protein